MLEAIAQKCEGLMLKLLDSAVIVKDEIKEEEVGDEGTADEDDQVDEVDDAVKPEEDQDEDGETIKKRGRRKALLATYEPDKRVESWVSLHAMLAIDFC
jgi:DNA ligase-1